MRLLLDFDSAPRVVDLEAFHPHATLAQLVEAVSGPAIPAEEHVLLDATVVLAQTRLADLPLLDGARLSRAADPETVPVRSWTASLCAGAASGELVIVPSGRRLVVGRAPQADLVLRSESASWSHCTIELDGDGVRVRDAGSTNGTLVDGRAADEEGVLVTEEATVVVGGAALSLRPTLDEPLAPAPGSLPNVTGVGTAPFNRPPRSKPADETEPLVPPTPKDIPPAGRFNVIAVAAPLAMAVVLVLVLGDLRFAMFALLSPVMAVGMYFEQRRARAKSLREEERRFAEALDELDADMRAAATAEVRRIRQEAPELAIVLRRPELPSTRLWERRVDEDGFLRLQLGVGDEPWSPGLDERGISRLDERVKERVKLCRLASAPIIADAGNAGVIGIVGEREGALALARGLLVQAAVHCGPADLTIAGFCDQGREGSWEWLGWMPHTRHASGADGARWLAAGREASNQALRVLGEQLDGFPTPRLLVLLDSEVLTEGRESPARELLGRGRVDARERDRAQRALLGREPRQVSGIVIARSADQLPASCTTVVEVGGDAACAVQRMDGAERIEDVTLAGLAQPDAERCARRLARFDDPELVTPGAALPSLVRLPELLGLVQPDATAIRGLWESAPSCSTPVGLGEKGPLVLDLVKDGPHGLVGGTTGSGKSEFLRSLVAGLAARTSPEELNFILIDFKGGAAFTACERLPHTIGTISNLDEQLADRALRALEAEMERRQRLFAAAGEGIDNLPAYLATCPAEPLPRLLLVIDEFAMLAKEYPDVLASLVSVAAVGRTLGIHMILATQRPAGVVNEDILANTNLRVALRVQSPEDSSSVISVASAASIERSQMGRAYVKLGQDDITPVQTALVTGRAPSEELDGVEVREVGAFQVPAPKPPSRRPASSEPNDLEQLIDAILAANAELGIAPPREVWPEALSGRVPLSGLDAERLQATQHGGAAPAAMPRLGQVRDGVVEVALADDPDRQRQIAAGWRLGGGNLILAGVPGSGTTTALASIALAVAASHDPSEVDLLCLDVGGRGLAVLAELPHTVAYAGAGAGSKEQQTRFIRHLASELARRRAGSAPWRPQVILIDGLATLRDELQDYEGQQLLDTFYRVYSDGPAVGMHFALSTARAKSVPAAIDEVTTQRWVFRLADAYDYGIFGIRGNDVPAPVPGRCIDVTSMLQMHVATPSQGLDEAVTAIVGRWSGHPAKASAFGALPTRVEATSLSGQLSFAGEPFGLPVGVREDTLQPAVLSIYEGEHVLVAGPARSGKSSLLLGIRELLRALPESQRPQLAAISDRRSPLSRAEFDVAASSSDEIPALLASLRLNVGPAVLFVDDAERVDDADQSLATLLASPPAGLVVVAAGRAAELRGMYSHWTRHVRKGRCGVLLQPDVDYDGELLSVKLPRTAPVSMTVGRGYACAGGGLALVQAMGPSSVAR